MSYPNEALMNEEFDWLLEGHEGRLPEFDNTVEPDVFEVNADAFMMEAEVTVEQICTSIGQVGEIMTNVFFRTVLGM